MENDLLLKQQQHQQESLEFLEDIYSNIFPNEDRKIIYENYIPLLNSSKNIYNYKSEEPPDIFCRGSSNSYSKTST
jgi:hypothetical protein